MINKKSNKSEQGASLVEYALLVALIAIISVVAIRSLGLKVESTYRDVGRGVVGIAPGETAGGGGGYGPGE